ncbi:hypothetical protein M422DRAFT_190966, partial [Sphaerobolus stellatus SS14]
LQLMLGCLHQTCDYYLDELQQALFDGHNVKASIATIWQALRNSGYTMKKFRMVSALKRADYTLRIGEYQAHQLVFVDESATDRRTTYRGRAWAIRGLRAQRKAFFIRGKRFSLLPALSLHGMISLKIVEGSFTATTFAEFIEELLNQMNPFPGPNSVIVMDNCQIHKRQDNLDMIIERGMRYEFLPPYSPDLNPIEEAFSAIKARLHRDGDLVRTAMASGDDVQIYLQLYNAVWSVTPQDTFGWYSHSGYL